MRSLPGTSRAKVSISKSGAVVTRSSESVLDPDSAGRENICTPSGWVVSGASVRSRSLAPVASHLHAQGGVLLAESFELDVISWTPILFATSAVVRAGIEGKAFRAQQ
ncbi:MAG: hypothetical protein QOF00_141 [Pseudonocardiales bacterium]|nr:hypothetical protein [Pseudonocardiales bacterium]